MDAEALLLPVAEQFLLQWRGGASGPDKDMLPGEELGPRRLQRFSENIDMLTALRKTPCLQPQTRPVLIAPAHQQRLFAIFFTRFGEKQRYAVN